MAAMAQRGAAAKAGEWLKAPAELNTMGTLQGRAVSKGFELVE